VICPFCAAEEISTETGACARCGYSPGAAASHRSSPDDLDGWVHYELSPQFEIGEELARSPHSAVYVAQRADPDVTLALRVLSRGPIERAGLADRWWRAMAAVNALDHPNIVPIYRFGTTANLAWYATRFAGGQSLAELLQEQGRMPPDRVARLVGQAADALEEAHRRDVIHGSLSPANIIVRDEGGVALLTELAVGPILDRIPAFGGKSRPPGFEAPEELAGRDPGPATDQYALAATFNAAVDESAELPTAVHRVLNRALSPEPRDRFPTIGTFGRSLTAALADAAAPGGPPSRHQPTSLAPHTLVFPPDPGEPEVAGGPPARRSSLLTVAIIAAVLIGTVLAAWFLRSTGSQPGLPRQVAVAPDSTNRALDTATMAVAPAEPPPDEPAPTPPPPPPPATRPAPRAERPDPGPEPTRQITAAGRVAPSDARTGRLFVSSRPWGALYVDDKLIGNTPQANVEVTAGNHRLRIVRDGFKPFEREVVVPAGQAVRLIDQILEPAS
jgi:eukaryotic-like serine/threonine-protein kinase